MTPTPFNTLLFLSPPSRGVYRPICIAQTCALRPICSLRTANPVQPCPPITRSRRVVTCHTQPQPSSPIPPNPPSDQHKPSATSPSLTSSASTGTSDSPPKPPADGGNDDKVTADEDGDGDGSGDDDEANTLWYDPKFEVPFLGSAANTGLQTVLSYTLRHIYLLFKYLRAVLVALFKDVPVSIIATIISASATIMASKIKFAHDVRVAMRKDEQHRSDVKLEKDKKLRESYRDLTIPLLKSAAKLADRMYQLVDGDISMIEQVDVDDEIPLPVKTSYFDDNGYSTYRDSKKVKKTAVPSLSPLYSAYLLARYFGCVEVMKNEHVLFDYGFPAADRILHNIVGRIQGLFCANDEILKSMQSTEQYFKGGGMLDGGLLKISPRAQVTLGELLWKSTWITQYDFVKKVSSSPESASRALLTFLEFSRIYEKDKTMQQWIDPVVEDFRKLEALIQGQSREERRNDQIGARIFFLQSGLCDLIDFFDPLPDTRAVSGSRRRRLQLSPTGNGISQRRPMSLQLLFHEIALWRDHRMFSGDPLSRMRLPNGIEVEAYVSSENAVEDVELTMTYKRKLKGMRSAISRSLRKPRSWTDSSVKEGSTAPTASGSKSPCALSQQALIILDEMQVPYKTVTIAPDAKPIWYYFMHPDNKTPVIYHDGHVVDDTLHMISYLQKKFPRNPKLASTEHLNIRPSIAALTKFHATFIRWLEGEAQAKTQLESQLVDLDRIVGKVKKINSGKALFGLYNRLSHEDVEISTRLHHVDVVGRAIKKWEIPSECVALKSYLETVRSVPSFARTMPSSEAIVESYGNMVARGKSAGDRVSDLLE